MIGNSDGSREDAKAFGVENPKWNTPWCNGNTAPFGGVIHSSNLCGVALERVSVPGAMPIFFPHAVRVRLRKLNASSSPSNCEFTAMKPQLMALAALALTAVLISGCSTTTDSTTTTTTTDRTQSSMYAR